jgi:hypothetical protein
LRNSHRTSNSRPLLAAFLLGLLAGAPGCGGDESPSTSESKDLVRIQYVYGGSLHGRGGLEPVKGGFEVIADGTTRARVTTTAENSFDPDNPEGSFVVWNGGDMLEYNPEAKPPYRQSSDSASEDSPLRGLRPTPDELDTLCSDATDVGSRTIAGRRAIHYKCAEIGGEYITTGIWLDEATGWMLRETFTDGGGVGTLTATEVEFGPDIDDDTFSTDLPAGDEHPSDP